jgi:hypothetical protein
LKWPSALPAKFAADEARASGKTYVVASTPRPAAAVYVFAGDHPDAAKAGINIMFEFTPEGACIRRKVTRRTVKEIMSDGQPGKPLRGHNAEARCCCRCQAAG